MNADRKVAQREYEAALATVRVAEGGTDEAAYNDAAKALAVARTNLIAAEATYPTAKESRRANRVFTLRNRGLDA